LIAGQLVGRSSEDVAAYSEREWQESCRQASEISLEAILSSSNLEHTA